MKRWYVVATKPASAAQATRSISRLGFVAFAPTIMVIPKRGARPVLKPMFRDYLFVLFDAAADPWTRIAGAWGVSRILTTGAPDWVPVAMPEREMEALFNMVPSEVIAELNQQFQRGDEVEVVQGPFRGLLGRLTRLDSRGRCALLLRILGGEIKAHVGIAQIARRRSA